MYTCIVHFEWIHYTVSSLYKQLYLQLLHGSNTILTPNLIALATTVTMFQEYIYLFKFMLKYLILTYFIKMNVLRNECASKWDGIWTCFGLVFFSLIASVFRLSHVSGGEEGRAAEKVVVL